MNDSKKKILKMVIIFLSVTIILTLLLNALFFKHEEELVYVTDTGDCYHSYDCSYLRSVNQIGIEQAKKQGYRMCSRCGGEAYDIIIVDNYLAAGAIAVLIEIFGVLTYGFYLTKKEASQESSTNNVYISIDNKYNDFNNTPTSSIGQITSTSSYVNNDFEEDVQDILDDIDVVENVEIIKDVLQPYKINGDITFFVLSDLRCSFKEIMSILSEKGFDEDDNNHVVIINGSISTMEKPFSDFTNFYDKMSKFNRIILIKNDVDEKVISSYEAFLTPDEIFYSDWYDEYENYRSIYAIDLLGHLVGVKGETFFDNIELYNTKVGNSRIYKIISNKVNSYFYFEIGNYIITHAWVPLDYGPRKGYRYKSSWRKSNYNEWLSAVENVDYLVEVPNKKIIFSAGWYDNKGLVCDGSRESDYIYSTEKYIKIHGGYNANCLVLKQSKNGEVYCPIGKKYIGYFFRHDNDILFEKQEVDCDISNENNLLKPQEDIKEIWKRVSVTQLDGKYSKYNYDDLLYGEIWFNRDSMTHLMHLYIPKNGYIKVHHLIAFSHYVYKDSVDDLEYSEDLDYIVDGMLSSIFETNGLSLDEENLANE